MKKYWYLFIINLLFTFIYACDGPQMSFDVYNNTDEKIIIYSKATGAFPLKRTEVNAKQRGEHFAGGISVKKEKPSEFFEYLRITKENGDVLYDLRGEALDNAFIVVEETDSFILYRMDVN